MYETLLRNYPTGPTLSLARAAEQLRELASELIDGYRVTPTGGGGGARPTVPSMPATLSDAAVQFEENNDVSKAVSLLTGAAALLEEESQWTDRRAAPRRDHRLPLVLPMHVTDQVEATLAARRYEQITQMTLSLAAVYAGIGGQVDLESLRKQLQQSLGRDFSSLFTVGRVNDNTIRVRLGARKTSDGKSWTAVPQTHNVSLLVLVPKELAAQEYTSVSVATHTEYYNARTAQKLQDILPPSTSWIRQVSLRVNSPLFNQKKLKELVPGVKGHLVADRDLRPAMFLAANNKYDEFISYVQGRVLHADAADKSRDTVNAMSRNLWLQIMAKRAGTVGDWSTRSGPGRA